MNKIKIEIIGDALTGKTVIQHWLALMLCAKHKVTISDRSSGLKNSSVLSMPTAASFRDFEPMEIEIETKYSKGK